MPHIGFLLRSRQAAAGKTDCSGMAGGYSVQCFTWKCSECRWKPRGSGLTRLSVSIEDGLSKECQHRKSQSNPKHSHLSDCWRLAAVFKLVADVGLGHPVLTTDKTVPAVSQASTRIKSALRHRVPNCVFQVRRIQHVQIK